jgi:hypothetical protein
MRFPAYGRYNGTDGVAYANPGLTKNQTTERMAAPASRRQLLPERFPSAAISINAYNRKRFFRFAASMPLYPRKLPRLVPMGAAVKGQ